MRHQTALRTSRQIALLVAMFVLVGGGNVIGQVDTGTILGTIRDQSGAAVPGAKVTLTSLGTYTVSAEFSGFQTSRQLHVTLNIQQQVVVDFSLQPGQITETIEVNATPEVLQKQRLTRTSLSRYR